MTLLGLSVFNLFFMTNYLSMIISSVANRKRYVFFVIITLCIALIQCTTDTSSFMFRGDAQHSGIYAGPGLQKAPSIKWTFATNGAVTSSAAIDENNLYVGSADGYLYCLDNQTGALHWRFQTHGAVNSSPAVYGHKVYFGSHDGFFYALDASDGKLRWQFKTDGERFFAAKGIHGSLPKDSLFRDDWDFFLSSPVVENGIMFFGTGSGNFYALNAATGSLNWKFQTGGVIHSSPAVAFGRIYFGSWDTYLYSLDQHTGALIWKFKTGEDTAIYNQTGIQGSPMVEGTTLYFGCRDSHLYALNALDGKMLWSSFNDYSWVSSTPVISREKLIYTTGDGRSLVALNKTTGKLDYRLPAKGWIFSSPALVDGTVYYGDLNGFLYSNDAASGKQNWCFQLAASKIDRYQILDKDSTLKRYSVFSAEKRQLEKKTSMQMLYSLGSIHSSPVIRNGVIYFGSTDGNIYALQ